MRFHRPHWFGNESLGGKMVFSFLPLLLGGEIGYRNRKGKRRWEHGWEIEGPFEQAFTFLFFLGVVVCGISANCCCCEGCFC